MAGPQLIKRQARRIPVIAAATLTLAGAAAAQAAPPTSSPGAAHASQALSQHAGGDSGHKVH